MNFGDSALKTKLIIINLIMCTRINNKCIIENRSTLFFERCDKSVYLFARNVCWTYQYFTDVSQALICRKSLIRCMQYMIVLETGRVSYCLLWFMEYVSFIVKGDLGGFCCCFIITLGAGWPLGLHNTDFN